MANLYWVGSRESDIKHTSDLFYGSITLYGTGNRSLTCRKNLRIDNNAASAERDSFVAENIAEVVEQDADAQFCFYDPAWSYEIDGLEKYSDRFICLNSGDCYKRFNNKIKFYESLRNVVPLLYKGVLTADRCGYDNLQTVLGGKKGTKYIVQAPVSNGGNGTFCVSSRNSKRVSARLETDKEYLVSEYFENSVPVNIHFVITDKEEIKFPGSVQIIRNEHDKLIYRGADFANYKRIPNELREKFEEYARKVAEYVRKTGYMGICGIDGMIVGDRVYVVEFNPRFQGSTAVLNKALVENGLPSMQEINIAAFNGKSIISRDALADLSVNYSAYTFVNSENQIFGNHILKNCGNEPYIEAVDTDGYSPSDKIDKNIYMYRILIKGNITSINADGGVYINENVVEPDIDLYKKTCKKDKLAVKITLMTLGVKLTDEAREHLLANGGIRPGNNNAIDMNVLQMVVNAPCDIKFIAFTPYTIKLNAQKKLELFYYDKFLADIQLYRLDPLGSKITSRGVPYGTVAYLSTDRLRVHMTNECIFKKDEIACKFCNIVPCKDPISLDDIKEVVYDYVANSPAVKHFLVGGQSMDQVSGMRTITEIARIIRSVTKDKKIYVMALPYDEKSMKALVDAGINEIACNIEIFDPKLAKQYMPGKGSIPRSTYYRVLSYATSLLPEAGSVRAMLIYGLEPEKSFLAGIRKITRLGIQPIISIFRPLPDTPLENLMAPPLADVYKLYHKAEAICERNGLRLGPACIYCQNNTLSLPDHYEDLTLGEI